MGGVTCSIAKNTGSKPGKSNTFLCTEAFFFFFFLSLDSVFHWKTPASQPYF